MAVAQPSSIPAPDDPGRVGRPEAVADSSSSPPEIRMLRDGFESGPIAWKRERAEASTTVTLREHDRSDRFARAGRFSERIAFDAGPGSGFYFSYPLPRVPATRAFEGSVHLRANRPGARLYAKVVLPADTDPETGRPSHVMVPGDAYEETDRWQRLRMSDFALQTNRQAQILRARVQREVPLRGAYVESLVLNVYSGPGATEVYIDELLVGPLPASAEEDAPSTRPTPPPPALTDSGSGSGLPAPLTAEADQADADRRSAEGRARENALLAEPPTPDAPWTRARVVNQRLTLWDEGENRRVDWFPAGIHAPGADMAALRRAGFDLLRVPSDIDPALAREAVRLGFLLATDPLDSLFSPRENSFARLSLTNEEILDRLLDSPAVSATAFWYLGDHLGLPRDPRTRLRERDRVRDLLGGLARREEPSHSPLAAALVHDLLPEYTDAGLFALGIPLDGWGSTQNPRETIAYFRQRARINARENARALFWTNLPARAPENVVRSVWGGDEPPSWGTPRVQPEQLRLYAYGALASGFRGFFTHGDASLTAPEGRPLLTELSFLNAEIRLLASILNNRDKPNVNTILDVHTGPLAPEVAARNQRVPEPPPHPTLRAYSFETNDQRGHLVLIADEAPGAQWQPPQMAHTDVSVVIPAPDDALPYEISLGDVRVLDRERVPGGVRVLIPEFDTTSIVLVTTDADLARRLGDAVARVRPRAVLMGIEQASDLIRWVAGVHSQLEAMGRPVPSADGLFQMANNHLKAAIHALESEDYPQAWNESRRARRPLRVLMRAAFDAAVKDLILVTAPTDLDGRHTLIPASSSPPAVAFNTLPQHYVWLRFIANNRFGANLLPDGHFNDPNMFENGWRDVSHARTDVPARVTSLPLDPSGRDRCLKLSVGPESEEELDKLPPFLDHAAAAVRTPGMPARAGELLRVRVMVRMPRPVVGGRGGVVVRDSIGQETLQFRTAEAIPDWKEVVLYRRAVEDGPFYVVLGLAGYGEAYFDNMLVERVDAPAANLDSGDVILNESSGP